MHDVWWGKSNLNLFCQDIVFGCSWERDCDNLSCCMNLSNDGPTLSWSYVYISLHWWLLQTISVRNMFIYSDIIEYGYVLLKDTS